MFGAVFGPLTRRLMEWVHEEGYCDEATRDKDWIATGPLQDGSEPLGEYDRVQACVGAFTSSSTKAELLTEALRRRMLVAPVATPQEVLPSEQLPGRDDWRTT